MMRRQTVFRLLLLSISLLVCTGLGELCVRAMAHWDYQKRLAAIPAGWPLSVPDKPYLYQLRPNHLWVHEIPDLVGGPTLVCRYQIDELGLRAFPERRARGPDTKCVLFIGDSFTFGLGTEDGAAFPHQVERLLLAGGHDVVCINAGVPGFNTRQERDYLAEIFDRERPDMVVVGFVTNDTRPIHVVPLPPREIYRNCSSYFLEELGRLANVCGPWLVTDRAIFAEGKAGSHPELSDFEPGNPDAEACEQALADMRAFCAQRNCAFLVAILPDFTRTLDHAYPMRTIHERVAHWGRTRGFATFDLLPSVTGRDHRDLRVPGDGHPNAMAHRLMTGALAPVVEAALAAAVGTGTGTGPEATTPEDR